LELLRELSATQMLSMTQAEDWVFASAYKLGRQPLSYTFVWENLGNAAQKAGIGHVSSHRFRHTHRTWLDSVGTPVGVQQKLMRHADIRTTMNIYGDAATADMREAHEKWLGLRLRSNGSEGWIAAGVSALILGWETGIEPATSGATVRCSAS
jgi:integrase